MKNTTKGHRVQTGSYLQTHAYALLSFAEKNEQFSWWLTDAILSYPLSEGAFIDWFEGDAPDPFSNIHTLCEPANEYRAMQRAQWLLSTLATSGEYDAPEVMGLLSVWAETREVRKPRHLIIGIVGLAIIGPTLGDISRKKKSSLPIIINSEHPRITHDTHRGAYALSFDILNQSLKSADGNAYRLDPETADWLFADKSYAFYKTSKSKWHALRKEAEEETLPVAIQKDTSGNTLLALPPSVDLSSRADIERVDQ